jgi:predicted transcriptional regulator
MARPKSDVLTDGEQRIMRVLWDRKEASVRDVTEALNETSPVAYNTVLTLLRILTDKGYVQPRQEGRAFVYRTLVSRNEARSQALKKLVGQFFEGSPTALAQHLLKNSDLSVEELDAIKLEIEEETVKPKAGGQAGRRSGPKGQAQ